MKIEKGITHMDQTDSNFDPRITKVLKSEEIGKLTQDLIMAISREAKKSVPPMQKEGGLTLMILNQLTITCQVTAFILQSTVAAQQEAFTEMAKRLRPPPN
jgi:hypothetical protein